MRGLLTKAFTPRVVEEQRDAIEENAGRMIDDMLAQDEPDLIASLAYPLPVMVIAGMLGVQDGDMATFKRWSDAIIQNVGNAIFTGDQSAIEDVNREFDEYFGARLNKLRQEPEDNLLSELVHAVGEDGSRLSQADLLLVCRVLLVAGNETTTGLIVNSIRAFSEFPDEMLRVKTHPELIPSAIEESLRYYAPFPATFRRTTRDVEVAGAMIPKGARVLPMLASANRDETQFTRSRQTSSPTASRTGMSASAWASITAWAPRLPASRGNRDAEVCCRASPASRSRTRTEDVLARGPERLRVRSSDG